MICVLETAASYGPKWALVLDEPVYKHGSGVADRLVMTSAEQRSDLDQETARIRASGRVLRLQGEDSARRLLITIWWYRDENLLRANIDAIRIRLQYHRFSSFTRDHGEASREAGAQIGIFSCGFFALLR
jgi:hypothetical protein